MNKSDRVIIFIALLASLFILFPHEARCNKSKNLLPNASYTSDINQDGLPDGWIHGTPGKVKGLSPSRFGLRLFKDSNDKAIWIEGGRDREGEWVCEIGDIEPDSDYLLTFWAYRDHFLNGIYPEIEVMGKNMVLDNHCTIDKWQYFEIPLRSPSEKEATALKFINNYPVRFYFRSPRLLRSGGGDGGITTPLPLKSIPYEKIYADIFPLGVYGASSDRDLEQIKEMGFNTVLIRHDEALIKKATALNLRFIIYLFNEKDSDIVKIAKPLIGHPLLLGWYIADEPELKSTTPASLRAMVNTLMNCYQDSLTFIALLRSRFIEQFKDACHIFMLDQYPIPHQPITWLSDSLEEAKEVVGEKRTWAVIQAFGGGDRYAKMGWPLFPTYQQMRSLSYLALVHKVHGLCLYSFKDFKGSEENLKIVSRVIAELKGLSMWLDKAAWEEELSLKILSPYKRDATGGDAIHYRTFRDKSQSLIIMVNTIDKQVELTVDGFPTHINHADVLFENRRVAIKSGNLRDNFGPQQTHIYKISGLIPIAPGIISSL